MFVGKTIPLTVTKDMSTKPRKRRKVKNATIDIDSVNIECSENFVNWIKLTKEKLKQRERKLLMVRIAEIESIISKQLYMTDSSSNSNTHSNNNNGNYKISCKFIESVLNGNLFPIIDKWKGVNMWRIKKPLNEFKDYFVKGRN